MRVRSEKIMMLLKTAIKFDGTGSDRVLAVPAAPLRRRAFSSRQENGKPRAFMLSLLIHVSVGAALCCQLVPQQFIRISGTGTEQKLLEVLLISEPAGAPGGEQAPAAAPKAAVMPEPAVNVAKKPKPAQKKEAAHSPRQSKEPVIPAAAVQAGEAPAGKAEAAAASREPAAAADAQGTGGTAAAGSGKGSGSGLPHDTSFGQADAPRFVKFVQPRYPLSARQQGREGTVVLRLTIDEKGDLVQLEVLSSPTEGFTEAAVEAMKRSTFAPAQRDGKAIASRAVLPLRFALRR